MRTPTEGHETKPDRGRLLRRTVDGGGQHAYYLYRPAKPAGRPKILVLIHGVSRNAREHMKVFQPYAERDGVTLVAPLFDEDHFRGYQRLGLNPRAERGNRADLSLHRILEEIGAPAGMPAGRFHLFGHSGGAQFAHRYAMAYPEHVIRYAISAAGWYTMPDLAVAYPHGMRVGKKAPGLRLDIERFLRIPACVLVGANDVERDATFKKSAFLDATQGRTRIERAERWVGAMTTAARWRGLDTPFALHVLPRAGHDFTELAKQGALAEVVFRCLFD
ncbi:MAG: hypothetical protein ACE5GS_09300 [Kiloniellaceae bacterium]